MAITVVSMYTAPILSCFPASSSSSSLRQLCDRWPVNEASSRLLCCAGLSFREKESEEDQRLESLVAKPTRTSSRGLVTAFAKLGARSALYERSESYVLIEPGQEEVFVTAGELRATLRRWLEAWPDKALPSDLARFSDLEDAVTYLVESACELEITDGSGSVQWFEVQLE